MPTFALVADWGVRPNCWLLILWSLVFGDQSAGHWQSADSVWVVEGKDELLGVVVDLLDLIQFQADEALVCKDLAHAIIFYIGMSALTSTDEDLVWRPSLCWGLILISRRGVLLRHCHRIFCSREGIVSSS